MSVQKSGWEAGTQSPETLGRPSPSSKDRRVDCVLIVDAGCPWFIVNPNYAACDQSIFSLQGHLSCPWAAKREGSTCGLLASATRSWKEGEPGHAAACVQIQTDHVVLTCSQNTHIHTLTSHVSPGRDLRDHLIQTSHFTNEDPEAQRKHKMYPRATQPVSATGQVSLPLHQSSYRDAQRSSL